MERKPNSGGYKVTLDPKNNCQPIAIYVQHYIHLDKKGRRISNPSSSELFQETPSSMGRSILVLDLPTCAQYGQRGTKSEMSLHGFSG